MNTKNKNKSNYKLHQENIIKDLKPEDYLPQIGEFGIAKFLKRIPSHFTGRLHNEEFMRKIISFNYKYKKNNFLKNLINKIIG